MKKPFVFFSKRLERGTVLWLIVCAIVIFIPRIEAYFFSPEFSYEWTYFEEKKYKFQQGDTEEHIPSKKKEYQKLWKACRPESLRISDWKKLGLSPKQAASMIRYRDKYGLKSYRQMQSILVLPRALLEIISDSLIFDEVKESKVIIEIENPRITSPNSAKSDNHIHQLDLNAATEAMLVALPGVGAYTAQKIIAYRDRLGGFLDVNQLQEVRGLNSETLEKIRPYFEINTSVQKIKLNEVNIERLKLHPYLTWNQANSIIKMRAQKGKFSSIDELKESVLIDEETYKKLLPYVSL